MTASLPIKALFLDIGGVLLTNGWDRKARALAARQFGLDPDDLNERHHLTFDTFESGKLGLEEYLDRIVFHEPRPFSRDVFKAFILAQSQPFPGMIGLMRELKRQYGLKVIAVNNEGRELNDYRIRYFGLDQLFDAFLSSCYVHLRKPDTDIFRLALDVAQVPAGQVVYIDDRKLFVQVAGSLGMHCLHHTHEPGTRERLAGLGLIAAAAPDPG
jgi:putative hydrolase of the HAD superfamily